MKDDGSVGDSEPHRLFRRRLRNGGKGTADQKIIRRQPSVLTPVWLLIAATGLISSSLAGQMDGSRAAIRPQRTIPGRDQRWSLKSPNGGRPLRRSILPCARRQVGRGFRTQGRRAAGKRLRNDAPSPGGQPLAGCTAGGEGRVPGRLAIRGAGC